MLGAVAAALSQRLMVIQAAMVAAEKGAAQVLHLPMEQQILAAVAVELEVAQANLAALA
jgi:hypothetical protein